MKYPFTSKRMSIVFRGLVLSLALILVACGSDSGDPTPTAGSDDGESAVPTVPSNVGTPESNVNEGDITILEPQFPATAEASTPDSIETEESTPADGPVDLVGDDEETVASTPADEEEVVAEAATPDATVVEVTDESTPASDEVEVDADADSTPATETDAAPTARATTGNETFTNPGDGTGGSGMPGEGASSDPDAEVDVSATPSASPVAQLTIDGCDVPDVPGFLGDNPNRTITEDVNFRSGPGVNCETVTEDGLGAGQTVEIIGGPVTQAEDDTEWVQVEVNGELGWITTEFLEEVDPE